MITKRIYLIFPPGCAGNHLANMLSFDKNVEDRITDYEQMKLHYHDTHVGHTKHPREKFFIGNQNLQNFDVDSVTNSTKTMILCGHASELAMGTFTKTIPQQLLEDSVFVLFTYPKPDTLAHKKMYSGPWIDGEHPDTHNIRINDIDCDIETAYIHQNFLQEWSFPEKPELDPFAVFEFNTDLFHSDSGFDYAEQYFNDLFGITLTKEAKELHDIAYSNWISRKE